MSEGGDGEGREGRCGRNEDGRERELWARTASTAAIRAEIERILAEADEIDAAEDELYGDARGDELPAELADPVTRRERSGAAARELEAEEQARQAEHEARVARRGSIASGPASTRRGARRRRLIRRCFANSKRNITDPDSRIMSTRGAHVQGYNAQTVVGEGQVILAAAVTNSGNDSNQLSPMLSAARENLDTIEHDGRSSACWPTAPIGTTTTSPLSARPTPPL